MTLIATKPDLYPYQGASLLWEHAAELNRIRRDEEIRKRINNQTTTRIIRKG